jgi:hypothetical protein
MKAHEAVIAWTPMSFNHKLTRGQVMIGPLTQEGERPDWAKPYVMTGGAISPKWREKRGTYLTTVVFVLFNTLVVRDGIPVDAAHEAFLAIDEYAETISPDIKGARD